MLRLARAIDRFTERCAVLFAWLLGLVLAFPAIATWLPDRLNRAAAPGIEIFDVEPVPDDAGLYQTTAEPPPFS